MAAGGYKFFSLEKYYFGVNEQKLVKKEVKYLETSM